jgi:hypothetical protein
MVSRALGGVAGERERSRVRADVLAFALAIILQTLTFAFYVGRLSARLDNVERNTEILLNLQLEKTGKVN